MKTKDPALNFQYPRLLAAIYFGLLSVVGTILINALLTSFGVEELIPVFQSVLLGMIVASLTGAVFGEKIIHCKKPYKATTFWLGFSMVIASLPLFDLGLVFFMTEEHAKLFSITKFHDLVFFYLLVLAYSYILFGFLLAIASGLAAMYLRGRIIYDVLHIYKETPILEEPLHKIHVKHR
jgi:hypothetical protein